MARARLAGFADEARAHGVAVEKLRPEGSHADEEEDWSALRRRLRAALLTTPKPCGVFCVDDRLAAMVCDEAARAGVSVPHDLAVLGVGNLEIACECSRTPLSSVALDPEAHGYAAAALLEELLDGKHAARTAPARLIPPVGVVERASTRGVAAHDPALARAVTRILDFPTREISVADLARHAGVGPKKLYELFASEFRCTPGEFTERTRLKAACRMLAETDAKLPVVASETGFGTPLRLHRAFLRAFGQSPGRWRKLAAKGGAGAVGKSA